MKFGKQATALVRDVAYATADTIPQYNLFSAEELHCVCTGKGPYHIDSDEDLIAAETGLSLQDEGVRLVLEEIKEHHSIITGLAREAKSREQDRLGRDLRDGEAIDWSQIPEIKTAMLIHHSAILRDKRMLLIYMNERMARIQELRWQQRSLPEHVQSNLSPSECRYFEQYSRTLQKFMSKSNGIGLDLTLYEVPPRDLQVKVIVKEELGEVVLSVGPTYLTRGSVHSLPRHEIERFLRSGQLEILDLNRD